MAWDESAAITDLIEYLRAEQDDIWAKRCCASALSYLDGAGVPRPAEDGPRADLYLQAAGMIAASYYDRRDRTISGVNISDNPAFAATILQLRYKPGKE